MKFLDELERINLPKDKFAVFGSGPLGVRELREIEDLDIVVKSDLWDELVKEYTSENGKHIKIDNIEIYKDWKPWFDIDKLVDDADIIDGYRYVKLKYVLEWKKKRGLEKDLRDIELIEIHLESDE